MAGIARIYELSETFENENIAFCTVNTPHMILFQKGIPDIDSTIENPMNERGNEVRTTI